MTKNDLDTLVVGLGQSLECAKRAESRVLVHLIKMALLELASIQTTLSAGTGTSFLRCTNSRQPTKGSCIPLASLPKIGRR